MNVRTFFHFNGDMFPCFGARADTLLARFAELRAKFC